MLKDCSGFKAMYVIKLWCFCVGVWYYEGISHVHILYIYMYMQKDAQRWGPYYHTLHPMHMKTNAHFQLLLYKHKPDGVDKGHIL